jgi:hypothetical protein
VAKINLERTFIPQDRWGGKLSIEWRVKGLCAGGAILVNPVNSLLPYL